MNRIPNITVIILTYNEEVHIRRTLENVRHFAHQVVVVDSYSSDGTIAIARSMGAEVYQHEFTNQANQFQWALDNITIRSPWIMRLDADELIEPDLEREIAERLPKLSAAVAGVVLLRKHIFMDRWIKHGGRYPLPMLRIWRTGQGRVEQRLMDEHVVVSGGTTVTFMGGFSDHNLNDLSYFVDKHNRYATREAVQNLLDRHDPGSVDRAVVTGQSGGATSLKRNVKRLVYDRLPFPLSPIGYFSYRFFVQGGFLDGVEGLIYHGLQGLWYRFLVGAKTVELERALLKDGCYQNVRSALERLTGLRID